MRGLEAHVPDVDQRDHGEPAMTSAGNQLLSGRGRRRVVEDARGRIVTHLDPLVMHLLGRREGIPAETLRAIAMDVDPRWTKYGRLALLVCGILVLVGVGGHVSYYQFVSGRGWSAVSILTWTFEGLIPVLWVYVFWHRDHQTGLRRVVLAMLKHRRCPHCGYDLRGLPPDPYDQAVVCPECGCAWGVEAAPATELPVTAPLAPSRGTKILLTCFMAILVLASIGGMIVFLSYR
jgi:hypothetical protein